MICRGDSLLGWIAAIILSVAILLPASAGATAQLSEPSAAWLLTEDHVSWSDRQVTADGSQTTITVTTITEWHVEEMDGASIDTRTAQADPAGRAYGPFRYIGGGTVDMIGMVDGDTPTAFRRLIAAHRDIRVLRMIECPGSEDDDANLTLARMVRRAGITTYVPAHGSVRSGAVELFLAGARRVAEPGAEFAVHSWQDELGREADDYAENDPVHRPYLDYYREIGMSMAQARAFYALTNSVSFADALYLDATDIARFVAIERDARRYSS